MIVLVFLPFPLAVPSYLTNLSQLKEAAPDMISEILAGGFEGGEVAAQQRADAAEAAGKILEEVCLLRRASCLVFQLSWD